MCWVTTLRCDRCRRVYRLRTGDPRFHLVRWQPADQPIAGQVNCFDRDGWCHRCRRPRVIESLPPPEMPLDPARARWRAERVSPPRCLCCGSAAVEPIWPDYRHPGCGGRLEVVGTPEHFIPAVADFVPPDGPPERGWLWLAWSHLTLRCT